MDTEFKNIITKLHLKSLGLTDYLIQEIVRDLPAQRDPSGFNIYKVSDVKDSIHKKLSRPKTKEESKEKLSLVLDWLEGKSNVVKADFLKRLPPEQRLEILYKRNEELLEKEKEIMQATNDLLRKAERMIAR